MPALDDLELVRQLLQQPPPSAGAVTRGQDRLAELAAAGSRRARSQRSWATLPGSRRPGSWRRGQPSRRGVLGAGLTLTAGAAAVAVVIAAGTAAPPTARGPHTAGPARGPHTAGGASAAPLSARQILLTAAVSAAKAPASGRYWVVREQITQLQAAGTAAHPYNIAERTSTQQWDPRSASRRSWYISKDTGATPATPADLTAWRAAGSPASWHIGGLRYGQDEQTFTMSPAAAQAWWQTGDNALGDLGRTPATLAVLQALPSDQARLDAVIRRDALTETGGAATSSLASDMFDTGVWLLTEPVTPQVRAAVYRVIAGLPGVRSVGLTTRQPGWPGDGVSIQGGGGEEEVIVVAPSTGQLLSDETVVTTAGRTRVQNDSSNCGLPQRLARKTFSRAQWAKVLKLVPSAAVCARLARDGSRYVQYGTQYQGQVTSSYTVRRAGWTNASPSLPAAQFGPGNGEG